MNFSVQKRTILIIVACALAVAALIALAVLAVFARPSLPASEPEPTPTTAATTSTTPTTTTTRIWQQNGRKICKTCDYVYDETASVCPVCDGQGDAADSRCPTCLGMHDTDEGQAWEYCSFCKAYFVVTEGAVHRCPQCQTGGLDATALDPEAGGLCENCIQGTHVCGTCGGNCHGVYRLNGSLACESCYAKAMYRTCEWCHTPKASVHTVYTYEICDDCHVNRRDATAAEYDAYIAWYEATYGPLNPIMGLNGSLEICPYCSARSVHNGIVVECDTCGKNALPPGM